jgi:hypothetical protein
MSAYRTTPLIHWGCGHPLKHSAPVTDVSDNYLRLIPTDAAWRPQAEAAQRAVATLSALVPNADAVEAKLYEEVTFIDQGANFEKLSCSACHAELAMDWWSEQMGHAGDASFTSLDVTTPCCGTKTSLNDLVYDWPAGSAYAELSVLNPQRGWLDEVELAKVATQLGHPLKQVMAHY